MIGGIIMNLVEFLVGRIYFIDDPRAVGT